MSRDKRSREVIEEKTQEAKRESIEEEEKRNVKFRNFFHVVFGLGDFLRDSV